MGVSSTCSMSPSQRLPGAGKNHLQRRAAFSCAPPPGRGIAARGRRAFGRDSCSRPWASPASPVRVELVDAIPRTVLDNAADLDASVAGVPADTETSRWTITYTPTFMMNDQADTTEHVQGAAGVEPAHSGAARPPRQRTTPITTWALTPGTTPTAITPATPGYVCWQPRRWQPRPPRRSLGCDVPGQVLAEPCADNPGRPGSATTWRRGSGHTLPHIPGRTAIRN